MPSGPANPDGTTKAIPPPTSSVFGVNELRLSGRQWLWVLAILVVLVLAIPRAWSRWERIDPSPDFRIPYSLSKDYWLYQRRLEALPANAVPVIGDSVVWGEYVRRDGTLSHHLNVLSTNSGRFVNAGVNGLFPLALEGLQASYGGALRNQKVLLHCNVLWLTSPKADLSTPKEEPFNHAGLVPQFFPRIPCYRADASARLTAVVERNSDFLGWVRHLQIACFDDRSLPAWTLADDGKEPPGYPNRWRSPLGLIRRDLPGEPVEDPLRGPSSPRHKPWSSGGATPTQFDWVPLEQSVQWPAFQRLVQRLRARDNHVLVLVGPFNVAMMTPENRTIHAGIQDGIVAWLKREGVAVVVAEPLPGDLFADASHPLTDGYRQMADRLLVNETFKAWLGW